MKIFIVSLFALILFIIVLVISRLTITAHYRHANKKDFITIRIVAMFGLLSKTFVIPETLLEKDAEGTLIEEECEAEWEEKSPFFKKLKAGVNVAIDWIRFFRLSKHTVRKFLKKTIVHDLSWQSIIGAGDAALTGKLAGVAWSVKGIVPMFAYQFMTVRCQPVIHLNPVFNSHIVQTEFRCIFSFRVGDAILTAIQLLRYWKRFGPRTPSSVSFKADKTVFQEE
ncbi:DUF2953 domain-containing protein [Bacillus sp. AGMB 02131]|uniref:DUF2953 domain-containing protein n=1 Tax=Peribacillus faecalis TaxID=2772559 RepID=A0A927D2Q8_9BACI|nr:DUF2953 domain-containing protein [Peribacillus faecalis]MBD3110470.1 DUF2953 domain-containing protein [Peribacillus faecalis]